MSFELSLKGEIPPRKYIWDRGERASVTGLHVRVTGGKKVFAVFYRTKGGRQRRPSIGDYPSISVGEARRRAALILARVAIGEDPKGNWDGQKLEPTVEEVFAQCMAQYWAPKVSAKWRKDVQNLWDNNLKTKLGGKTLSEIRPSMLRDWQNLLSEKPYAANRSLEVLSRVYSFAIERELIPQGANPCLLVKALPEKKRKRFATPEEIKTILQMLDGAQSQYPQHVAFIYLLIYTGSRPSLIERARWEDLEIFEHEGQTYGALTLAGKNKAKTGDDDTVILPPKAMEVISTLPRVEGKTICGIGLPRKFWNEIRKAAGCEDLWARDWRRTFATVGLSNGVNIGTIGELLNHKSTQTTAIYAKLLPTSRVEAVAAIAKKLEALSK